MTITISKWFLAGVNDYDAFDPWYGTDATGSSLPNNAKATVRVEPS